MPAETGKAANRPPFLFLWCSENLHLVALDTVTGRYECVLAVVTGAARLAFIHLIHLCLERSCLEGEDLGVAVSTLVHAEMEFMAEVCFASLGLEKNVARFVAFVALVAFTGYGKGIFAIVTGAA